LKIRPAKSEEVCEVLQLIQDLATYEKAPEQVEASKEDLLNTIFVKDPRVFCDLVEVDGQVAGMAIWFLITLLGRQNTGFTWKIFSLNLNIGDAGMEKRS